MRHCPNNSAQLCDVARPSERHGFEMMFPAGLFRRERSDVATLKRECEVFCRHLVGRVPSEHVVHKYVEFHKSAPAQRELHSGAGDRLLVGIAALSPAFTQLADAFSCIVRPAGVLRKKLVLLLALLETSTALAEHHEAAGSRLASCVRLMISLALAATVFLASLVVLLPFYLIVMTASRRRVFRGRMLEAGP
jgi:hypothetical protein